MKGGAVSAKYILVSNLCSKLFLLISNIILARILDVEDFGYLLTLNIVFGFLNLFSISGYEFYFIQNKKYSGETELNLLRQVFNLRILQSVMLFIITNLLAGYCYYYYDYILGQLLFITSFIFLVSLIAKPEEAFLTKNLDYKVISISRFIRDFSNGITQIIFALLGAGALSFSLGNVIGNLSYNLNIKLKENIDLFSKTNFRVKTESYSKIRIFGFHLFLNTAGSYFTKQVDKIFVATFFDKSGQGNYQFGHNQAGYSFNAFISPQNNMVLSLMTNHKDNVSYLMKLFNSYGFVVGNLLLPFIILLYIIADEIIPMIFGVKWIDAILYFRIFTIYYVIKILFYPGNGILTSIGRPDIKARITVSSFIISLPILIYIAYAKFGLEYYAIIFVCIATITDLLTTIIGFKYLNYSFFKFTFQRFKVLIRYILLVIILMGISYLELDPYLLILLGVLLTCLFIYGVLYSNRDTFIEAMKTFVKNERILTLLSKCLLIR